MTTKNCEYWARRLPGDRIKAGLRHQTRSNGSTVTGGKGRLDKNMNDLKDDDFNDEIIFDSAEGSPEPEE